MKNTKIISILLALFVLTLAFNEKTFSAEVTVSFTNAIVQARVENSLSGNWTTDISKLQNVLTEGFATSFAITDLIGSTKIETFEIGVGITGNISSEFVPVSSELSDLNRGFGIGGAVHVGLAGGIFADILKDFDFIIRIFVLPEISADNYSISAWSFGVKPRWHWVDKVGGSFFSWGGVTVAVALDYTSVTAKISGLTGEVSGTEDTGGTYTGNLTDSNLELNIGIFTFTPEIMTNYTLLYFLTHYLAFGTILNLGSTDVSGTADVTITTAGALTDSGIITLSGSEGGNFFIPYLRTGLEFNLWILKITVQGQLAFASETIYGGGAGIRLDF